MADNVLLGMGRHIIPVPPGLWHREVDSSAHRTRHDLDWLTPEHRRVHHHVVRELPRAGRPLAPEEIAAAVDLPLSRVQTILDDLEKHMTFLFRDAQSAVEWAYPVTAAPTPHRVTFSTGEQIYAA
jgi:hypothetical protein